MLKLDDDARSSRWLIILYRQSLCETYLESLGKAAGFKSYLEFPEKRRSLELRSVTPDTHPRFIICLPSLVHMPLRNVDAPYAGSWNILIDEMAQMRYMATQAELFQNHRWNGVVETDLQLTRAISAASKILLMQYRLSKGDVEYCIHRVEDVLDGPNVTVYRTKEQNPWADKTVSLKHMCLHPGCLHTGYHKI